jgi:hypothetical protein
MYTMFVDEIYNVNTIFYQCLAVEKHCRRSLNSRYLPEPPLSTSFLSFSMYLVVIKIIFRAVEHQAELLGRYFRH